MASQARAQLHKQPNRAALSVRARNALPLVIIEEPEEDLSERDKRLPGRVAALSKADIGRVPGLGKRTIIELEVWLWDRGLSFSG